MSILRNGNVAVSNLGVKSPLPIAIILGFGTPVATHYQEVGMLSISAESLFLFGWEFSDVQTVRANEGVQEVRSCLGRLINTSSFIKSWHCSHC